MSDMPISGLPPAAIRSRSRSGSILTGAVAAARADDGVHGGVAKGGLELGGALLRGPGEMTVAAVRL